MPTRLLRNVSVGLVGAVAVVAWADTMYSRSAADSSVISGAVSVAPRYAPQLSPERANRRQQRTREADPGNPCNSILCDKSRFDQMIATVASGYGVESALLHAIVAVESRYNPSAVSPDGALGLMQLMPATAKRYGVVNALDPEQNLRAGARYLRDLLEMFNSDTQLVIAAYHAGGSAVARYRNSIPPFRATMEYVSKVLDYYHMFRAASAN